MFMPGISTCEKIFFCPTLCLSKFAVASSSTAEVTRIFTIASSQFFPNVAYLRSEKPLERAGTEPGSSGKGKSSDRFDTAMCRIFQEDMIVLAREYDNRLDK